MHTMLQKLTSFPDPSISEMIAITIMAVFVRPTNARTDFGPFLTNVFYSAVTTIMLDRSIMGLKNTYSTSALSSEDVHFPCCLEGL